MNTLRRFASIAGVLVLASVSPLLGLSNARAAGTTDSGVGDLHASAGLTAEAPSAGRLGAPPARPFDVAAELRRRLAFQAPSASKSQAHGLATLTSVADGNWNNPATWGGSVPTSVDDVIIADGTTVTIVFNPRCRSSAFNVAISVRTNDS